MRTVEPQNRNTDLTRANKIRRLRQARDRARDPAKLDHAVLTVQAALGLGLLTVDDLTRDETVAA